MVLGKKLLRHLAVPVLPGPEGSRLKRKWPGWMGGSATILLASFFRTFVIKNTWRHLLLAREPPGRMYHVFDTFLVADIDVGNHTVMDDVRILSIVVL